MQLRAAAGSKKGDGHSKGWLLWQLRPQSMSPNTLAATGRLFTNRQGDGARRRAEMNFRQTTNTTRRNFLAGAPWLGAAVVGAAAAPALLAEQKQKGKGEEEVSTNEDLMREHGVLKRVLLVYEEVSRRIRAKSDFPPQTVTDSAKIIRDFIENYHEKLEEDYLFPRFRKAGKLVELVDLLLAQHQAGRRVTERILATVPALKTEQDREQLAGGLHAFVRMFAPHVAREGRVPGSVRR